MIQETSVQTYTELIDEGKLDGMQHLVYQYLLKHPDSTDSEIASGLGFSDMNKTRPRRNELADREHFDPPLVIASGKRLCSVTQKTCIQWRINDGSEATTEEVTCGLSPKALQNVLKAIQQANSHQRKQIRQALENAEHKAQNSVAEYNYS